MELIQVHCPCLRIINQVILNDLIAPNLIDRPISKALGRLVPKTIGTGLLVPQPMDDWYLRLLVPGLLVPKTGRLVPYHIC